MVGGCLIDNHATSPIFIFDVFVQICSLNNCNWYRSLLFWHLQTHGCSTKYIFILDSISSGGIKIICLWRLRWNKLKYWLVRKVENEMTNSSEECLRSKVNDICRMPSTNLSPFLNWLYTGGFIGIDCMYAFVLP